MEEKYKAFLQYNFDTSEEYKDFKEKFPIQPHETVELHKKRFYKSHICRDFDVNYIPPPNPRNTNNNNNNNNFNIPNVNNNVIYSNKPPLFEIIDFGLIGLSLITFNFFEKYYNLILLIYFCYRLFLVTGFPRFNLEFLKIIVHNNNFSYLVLTLVLLVTRTKNYIIGLPITIYNGLYLIKGINKYYKLILFDKIIRYESGIFDLTLYLEILNVISCVIGLITRMNKFYFIFVYIQYLKFRYYANERLRENLSNLRTQIDNLRDYPFIRGISNFIRGASENVSFNGGVVFCNIF